MDEVILGEAEARRRHVARRDYVACKLAFIDCKKPGSHLKENYSIIGPGVTQSADQVVNLREPHGFSIGAAAMPHGIVNNLHIHYTAEVFMCFDGAWEFRWGRGGADGSIVGRAGDIVSVPTWIFRGFKNVGPDDGWLFTALGGDDTGGIIWDPEILADAASHGLYLTRDNMLVDTAAGAAKPRADRLMVPISEADMARLRRWTPEQMRGRVVTAAERRWSDEALLCTALAGHRCALAPVIGYGISEDRDMAPRITNPHGFAIEWLRLPPGESLARHRIDRKQVLMVHRGAPVVVINEPADAVEVALAARSTYSVPAGAWREIANRGDVDAEVILITAGDGKAWIDWAPEIVAAANRAGLGRDHNGCVAPAHLLPLSAAIPA